jgi:hypothetical protein
MARTGINAKLRCCGMKFQIAIRIILKIAYTRK